MVEICIIYYIKNNYMFRSFSLAIFRLKNEKLSKQLHSTCVGCIQCTPDIVPVRYSYGFRIWTYKWALLRVSAILIFPTNVQRKQNVYSVHLYHIHWLHSPPPLNTDESRSSRQQQSFHVLCPLFFLPDFKKIINSKTISVRICVRM